MRLTLFLVFFTTSALFSDTDPFYFYHEDASFSEEAKNSGELNCPFNHNSLYKQPPRTSCFASTNDPKFEIVCSKCFYYYEPRLKYWKHFHKNPESFSMPLLNPITAIPVPRIKLLRTDIISLPNKKKLKWKTFSKEPRYHQTIKDKIVIEEHMEFISTNEYDAVLSEMKTHLNNSDIKNILYDDGKLKCKFTGTWGDFIVSGDILEHTYPAKEKETRFQISFTKMNKKDSYENSYEDSMLINAENKNFNEWWKSW